MTFFAKIFCSIKLPVELERTCFQPFIVTLSNCFRLNFSVNFKTPFKGRFSSLRRFQMAFRLLILTLLLVIVNGQFTKLPWVIRKLYPIELSDFYSDLTINEEKKLVSLFRMSGAQEEQVSELLRKADLDLYKRYQLVFPVYYSKLNRMSNEASGFYRQINLKGNQELKVMEPIKKLIRKGAYEEEVYRQFLVIKNAWDKMSKSGKSEIATAFPNVVDYLNSQDFIERAKSAVD
ncbi:hypothetical protein M3Y96_01058300 [Aphelenchoides besseyi]|nr:hypothetical protein M3Y96_01058300 [Aphelenchoides besseyi]